MLKLKLTKDEQATLPDAIKAEYKAEGDGFILDTDVPFEDTLALKNATLHEKTARKAATDKVKELETQIVDLTARAGSAGDLEKSWKGKLTKAEQDAKAREDTLTKQLRKLVVDNEAVKLAGEISTAPELLLPHIRSRLTMEEVDGEVILRVLDAEGKASAASVNDFRTEILANKSFAPILTASKASGGGAAGSQQAPAGGKPFAQMNEAEKVALFKSDRSRFDQLAAAAKNAA